jgi:ion channel-forming bestrophin family protein
MIVKRNLPYRLVQHYAGRDLIYYFFLSVVIVVLHDHLGVLVLEIPAYTIAALGIALAIFLGFKNDHAYDRWWEARRVWGQMVNYSRAWSRQVTTLIMETSEGEAEQVRQLQQRMVRRHVAFVNALRVSLRVRHGYTRLGVRELYEATNDFSDAAPFLEPAEYEECLAQDNPPNFLLQKQGEDLKYALKRGWLSDYRLVRLDKTLVDFNDIQGISERIKNTPLPRQYSFYSRVFVLIHCSLLPMVFVSDLGWKTIPVALAVSFVFHVLDLIGDRTEDPFENRLEDIPLTALSVTIERNLREVLRDPRASFPPAPKPYEGIVF